MDLWSSALISVLLLAAAGSLLVWHVRQWRAVDPEAVAPEEYDFRWRQFRRRMQTSSILGVLAASIFVGAALARWIPSNLLLLIYWIAVLLLVAWVVLLAIADILATKFYYGRIRSRYLLEKARLEAELRRVQTVRSNGKEPKKRAKDEE